jgi:hypothetical protein
VALEPTATVWLSGWVTMMICSRQERTTQQHPARPATNPAIAASAIIFLIRFVMLFSSVLFVVFLLLFPWPAANRKTTGAHAVTRA